MKYFPQGGHTVKFYCSHCGILFTMQGGHTVKHFPQGGHTVKFYCSHCGILFTGWSHCEILSTGWPHCEMLLFTLWNIIHRMATLWNSTVHIVEYFPQGGHTVKSSFTMWASKFTLWNRTSLCEHSVVNHTVEVSTLWTQCKHSVFTESTMWTHCEHTVGHCVLSSRDIIDPEWSLAPMDPFPGHADPGFFRVYIATVD